MVILDRKRQQNRPSVTPIRWLQTLIVLMISVLAVPCQGSEGPFVPDVTFLRVTPESNLSLNQAIQEPGWQPLSDRSPNFGYINDPIWLSFRIPPDPKINLLEIGYSHLDHIRFFLLRDGKIVDRMVSGDRLPFSERPIQYRNFLFPFEHDDSADYRIVLEIRSKGAMQVPLQLWNSQAFFENAFREDLAHAVYYGILITVIFFNVFIFFALREPIYLLYVLSTLGYLSIIACLNGVAYQLFWPASPDIQNQAMLVSIPFTMIATLWFSSTFLELRTRSPAIMQAIGWLIAVNAVAAGATFVIDYNTAIRLVVALAIPCCLLLTFLGPQQWLRGNRQAVYYTLAWGALTLGSAITAMNKYGLLPNTVVTVYGIEMGSALQAVLLALALAVRIYRERQDKVLAQSAELRALEARRSVEHRLMEQALHHPLTGLPNRGSFEMTLSDLISREPDRRYGIAVIHLENLDSVTKTLGHRNTDRILELASRAYHAIMRDVPGVLPIEQTERHVYYLASLDPQSFALITDASRSEAMPKSVVRCLEQLRRPIDYLGMQVPLDPRIGVAIFPEHGDDANTLVRRAIIAEGSDRARDRGMAYYKPSRDAYSAERLTLVSELRHALENNELALYLQPKQSLHDNTIVGMEALIRWPDRKDRIRPDEIVLLAEQTGLIKPLTRWVLEEALSLRSRLLDQGWELDLSVNISPNNLREADFSLYVQRLMQSYHSHQGAVTFEVTETSMMLDPTNALEALNALDGAGIRVSIDDFGSGYSSLSYIKQLPAGEIKIDQSLIRDLATQSDDRVIVQTTIDMCHSLGYEVVAEGVENEEVADQLRGMGCDMIQGYLLTPPLPFAEFMDWLGGREPGRAHNLG